MTQDTNVQNLIINKLTKVQYESIETPDPTQLYFITDEVISSSDVVNALGYTPYNATNPDGFISSATVSSLTDVALTGLADGQVLKYNSTIQKWENSATGGGTWGSITGTLSNQTDLQNALDAKQNTISDLSTIRSGASLGATALQPNDNITELVNNAGYITGITSSDVTTALGYTPYNSTNPSGYITSSALTNYVTTDTAQNISGRKTFLGEKAIYFKQNAATDKLGFTLYNPSNAELGALEYRPNTINGNALLALNCSQTGSNYVGFRYWSGINIVAPRPTTNGNYFIPVNVTDGTNTVTANNNGTLNISSLLPDVSDMATQTWVTNQGYTTNVGTVTSVNSILPDSNGNVSIPISGTPTWGGITGNISDQTDLASALNNKYDASNPNGFITSSALSGLQTTSNLVTSVSSSSTDAQYPSAKCVYDIVGDIETLLQGV